MKTVLTVTHAFGDYARGDMISDADTIAAVLEANPSHVVRTQIGDDEMGDNPPPPAPAPKPAPAAPAAKTDDPPADPAK